MAAPSAQDFNFSSHEYTSLPSPSSIRLLSLVDDSGCPQKASICGIRVMQYTLMTVDLDDDPDYDALSYTWGSPFPILGGSRIPPEYATTNRWPIAVNGKLFFITKNLFDALSGLHSDAPLKGVHKRYPPYNKTELIRASEEGREADVRRQPNNGASVDLRRPIWIDVVCVNQNNILERNAQVSMMARIYKSAQQVKIWLGPEDISPEKVIDRVASSGSEKAPKVKDISIGYSKAHLQPLVVWTSVNGEHEIKELLRRTWFSRIWVIQELALAKSVKILCGKHQFDGTHLFERILKDLSVVTNSGEIGCIGDVNMKSMLGVEARACLLADAWIRERTESTGRQHSARTTHCFQGNILPGVDMRLSLPILLALTRDFQASDPRDKIFAILGLSRLPGRHSIKIDYSRSVVDIYTEVGRIFVEACGNNEFQDSNTGEMQDLEPLEGLSFVQAPIIEHNECYYCKDLERTPDLPSWVPDFKTPLVTPPLFCKRFRAAAGSQYTTYKATDRI